MPEPDLSGRITEKTFTTTALALAAGAGIANAQTSAGCDSGEMVIKFSHVTNADNHPKGIAASLLQERVNAEMDGTACMEVYSNSARYNDDQVLEAMLRGDVQLAAPSLSKFETFAKVFSIHDLPFMFAAIDAVDRFQSSEAGQEILDAGAEIRELADEERRARVDAMRPVRERFESDAGADNIAAAREINGSM